MNVKYNSFKSQSGFTLQEMMIVVAIIGVLAAIAYPSFQISVIKSKRVDMMTDMQDIANNIESSKLAKSSYAQVDVSAYETGYPFGEALYNVTIANGGDLTSDWTITATPVAGSQVSEDGVLTLNFESRKCRTPSGGTEVCGYGDEWND